MKGQTRRHVKKGTPIDVATLPQYCDFSCRHAQFASADSVGACRREQGVYCALLKQFNNKNSVCAARK